MSDSSPETLETNVGPAPAEQTQESFAEAVVANPELAAKVGEAAIAVGLHELEDYANASPNGATHEGPSLEDIDSAYAMNKEYDIAKAAEIAAEIASVLDEAYAENEARKAAEETTVIEATKPVVAEQSEGEKSEAPSGGRAEADAALAAAGQETTSESDKIVNGAEGLVVVGTGEVRVIGKGANGEPLITTYSKAEDDTLTVETNGKKASYDLLSKDESRQDPRRITELPPYVAELVGQRYAAVAAENPENYQLAA